MHFSTENGDNLHLSKQIGHGGEGNVFLIANKPSFVAKIYHQKLPEFKEHKLRNMLHISSEKLKEIAAWPTELIVKKSDTGIYGVILPYIEGFELHTIYGPNERKLTLPEANWDFLYYVARNLAISFDVIHSHNVVLGDVNEKNFLVDKNALVRVIDCDSFQIPSRTGKPFLCTVGVEHYTPPELQGLDLGKNERNKNHDCFGLAVLIFQLLFMARHPFAMVSKNPTISSLSFGESIARYLYAYSRWAPQNNISPPPLTLPTTILPQPLCDLFETAFSQTTACNRPSAAFWMTTLNKYSKNIVTCRTDKSHKYCNHLVSCPWCEFTSKTGLSFFISSISFSKFDFNYQDISSLRATLYNIQKHQFHVKLKSAFVYQNCTVKPIPFKFKLPAPKFYAGFVLIAFFIFLTINFPLAFIGVFWGIYLIITGIRSDAYKKEIKERKNLFAQSENLVNELQEKLFELKKQYENVFDKEYSAAKVQIDRYSNLKNERDTLLKELENRRQEIQLENYLQKFFISKHKIRDIGEVRTMTLVSYGIETAADIKIENISRIPGFGNHLCGVLIGWRKACEKNFKYNQNQPVPPKEFDIINKKIADQKQNLQEGIQRCFKTLTELNRKTQINFTETENNYKEAINKLAEAEANVAIVKK